MEIKGISDFINWFENTNQPTVLIGIILGVLFQYFFSYYTKYTKAKNKDSVKFDKKELLITSVISIFLSVILYSTALSKVGEMKSDLLVLSISAQTGFFWQSIINQIKSK